MQEITLDLPAGGTLTVIPAIPRSFAARIDLLTEYQSSLDKPPRFARVMAATLGIALAGERPVVDGKTLLPLPGYAGDGDIIGYGGKVLDALFGRWRVIPNEALWTAASNACLEMVSSLPRAEEVEAKRDFSSPRGEDLTTP